MTDPTEQEQRPRKGWSRRSFLIGVTALTGGVMADALAWEPRSFVVEELSLALPKIPPGRELRMVQLSDLHIRSFHSYFREVAKTVNSLTPEVILLTGDYLERSRNLKSVRQFLDLLDAPSGIFAIQGNWEYWSRLEGENLRRNFAASGATLLTNERHDLELQRVPISIHGLDYPSPSNALDELRRQADSSRLNLVLSHVPAFDHELLEGWADLVLCGHTHGGQVRIPFVPPFYLPRMSGDFVAGLYPVGRSNIPLYVTRGVGTSVFPVRFLCRPEITLLRLQAETT